MLEVDLELVAFLGDDLAAAELAVEHALAELEVGAALLAEETAEAFTSSGLLQPLRAAEESAAETVRAPVAEDFAFQLPRHAEND